MCTKLLKNIILLEFSNSRELVTSRNVKLIQMNLTEINLYKCVFLYKLKYFLLLNGI